MIFIKDKRLKSNLTQVEFAKIVGVAQSTVAEWEAGRSAPLTSKLPQIAEVLHCTVNDLFKEEE